MLVQSEFIIKQVAKNRKLDIAYIKKVWSSQLITVAQLSDLTGLSKGAIHSLTITRRRAKRPKLSLRYPFPHKGGNGFLFVINDDECKRLIQDSNKEQTP